ncbi:MAG: ATP-dependent zinc protease [Candidatus Saccharimonadales bacterium]
MQNLPIVVGAFEEVAFPSFGIDGIKAKIDTGAYTGALHCTKIAEEITDEGTVLRFAPFDHPEVTIIADEFLVRYVKSSNGERDKRYFIKTKITVQSKTYPITLSLADRSEMNWPVLIGRRFLRRNHFLVDVNKAAK